MWFMTRTLAGAAALVLVLGACGDDDDDDTAAAGGDTTEDVTDGESDDVSVELTSPGDGEEVTSPVTVSMTASGVEIEPAGEARDGAGHFHVMVDVGCVDPGESIPVDTDGYNHFGDGSTETELELEPGEHTLCLQVGDGVHTALDATDEITVTVTG